MSGWLTKGRKEGSNGRKKEEQIPLSVTFLTGARNPCTERLREEDGEMRPSEMGTVGIKEHYTCLLLKCSQHERKPLSVSHFLFHLSIKLSIDGTVQTSLQLRCFSASEGTEIRAATNSNSRFSFFKKGKRSRRLV